MTVHPTDPLQPTNGTCPLASGALHHRGVWSSPASVAPGARLKHASSPATRQPRVVPAKEQSYAFKVYAQAGLEGMAAIRRGEQNAARSAKSVHHCDLAPKPRECTEAQLTIDAFDQRRGQHSLVLSTPEQSGSRLQSWHREPEAASCAVLLAKCRAVARLESRLSDVRPSAAAALPSPP